VFNKTILIGNLTKDPELKYTTGGTPVANMRLAVNQKFKVQDDMKEEVLFIDVVVWGNQGEACSQHLSKGSQCLVEGRLKERSWEKDGEKKSKVEIVAQNVRFLTRAESTPQSSGGDQHSDIEPF
jgi:single-strand DNA-binding protein